MWASLYYEPPVSSMIRELKHLADLGMSRPLADLMCQNAPDWLATEHFDFVLPMPLSKERRLKRGFNQSEALTDILANVTAGRCCRATRFSDGMASRKVR